MTEVKGETAPALGISLSMQYAGGRTVVFQTHVAQEASQADVDKILDKLNGSADRAEAFYAQEQARRQLEVEEKALVNIKRRLGEVDALIQDQAARSPKRNQTVGDKEARERKQALDNIAEGERRVAECKGFLADLVKKAGNRDGASSPTDS
jgi:hypothetical protein